MRLDALDAFGFPFGAQAFAFFSFANGAIALPDIEAVIDVALFAMGLLRIDVAGRRGIALRVLGNRYSNQMLRVDASTVAANVVHHEAFWNGLVRKVHRNTVSFSACAAEDCQ